MPNDLTSWLGAGPPQCPQAGCGTPSPGEALYCMRCGTPLYRVKDMTDDRDRFYLERAGHQGGQALLLVYRDSADEDYRHVSRQERRGGRILADERLTPYVLSALRAGRVGVFEKEQALFIDMWA